MATESRFLQFWRFADAVNAILKLPPLTGGQAHRAWCEIHLETVRGLVADSERGRV